VSATFLQGDVIDALVAIPDGAVHCCVTSPPYWGLRDYGHDGQIGLEPTPEAYVARMVEVFREVRRVLREDGTCWLNLGDSYSSGGSKPKDLVGIPWRVAFALQADGWYLRQDIIWHKPNPMPESVRDRCTRAHEYVFLLTKSERYFYDAEAVKEASITRDTRKPYGSDGAWAMDGRDKWAEGKGRQRDGADATTRNRRSVWTIPPKGYKGAHFAVMPAKLAEVCILAGTSEAGCCRNCGKPLTRKVSRTRVPTRPGTSTKATQPAIVQGNRDPLRHVTKVEMMAWGTNCECAWVGDAPSRCVVLDPFAGSGTTLAVSEKLGRDSVGIELNPDYIKLAKERVGVTEDSA